MSINNTTDLRFRWMLSAGEAKLPRSLCSLRGLDFLAVPAGVAIFHYNQYNVYYYTRRYSIAYRLEKKSSQS